MQSVLASQLFASCIFLSIVSVTGQDLCTENVCQNGGTCSAYLGEIYCVCSIDFTGDRCQNSIVTQTEADCTSDLHCGNGFCDVDGSCVCWFGWHGKSCDMRMCTSDYDCNYHGSCDVDYQCTCYDGYTGTNCESTVSTGSDCSSNYDCNYGSCSDGKCVCWTGYSGTLCDEQIPACAGDSDCNYHGTCVTYSGGYCVCDTDYEGRNCETKKADCDYSWDCQNGGVCQSDGTCSCTSSYSGKQCEVRNSDCTWSYECNDGYCDSYGYCACNYGYSGTYCEIDNNWNYDYDDDYYDDDEYSSGSSVHYIIVSVVGAIAIFIGICICRFRMQSRSASAMTNSSATSTVITSGAQPTGNANTQEYQYRPSWYQPFDQQGRNVRVPPPTSGSPIPMQTIVPSPTAPPELSNDNPPAYDVVAPANEQSGLPPPPSYEAALLISDSAPTNDPSAPPLPLPGDSS
ncbi:uncharacterized protein LOC144439198 isoform X3 [Glandiceps talaboti]